MICGVVTFYFPSIDVFENIKTYFETIDFLVIIDNSPTQTILPDFFNQYSDKIQHLHCKENIGIAKALNKGIKISQEKGASYLLTMDQDSSFKEHLFENYYKRVINFKDDNVAMFGVETSIFDFNKLNVNSIEVDCKNKILITSGSIINLESINKIGFFDENLFIDEVDTEFCYRTIEKKFKLILFPDILLHHSLGELKQVRLFFGLVKLKRSFHNPQRIYYFVRNYFYVSDKYLKSFKVHRKIVSKNVINSIKNNLLYSPNKIQTIKFIFKAFSDHKKVKFGKFN